MPRLYTIEDLIGHAAEQGIRLSKDTIYTWLQTGRLLGFKLNGPTSGWRIDERDWDQFIEDRRAEAIAERKSGVDA